MVKKVGLTSFISTIKNVFRPKTATKTENQKFLKSIGKSIKEAAKDGDSWVPNFIQRDGDHAGITSGKIKFYDTDIKKMEKMTAAERTTFENKLMDEGQYYLEDLQ